MEDFEQARPRILGALLDAVSAAIRNLRDVTVDRPGRMADFEKWVTAAGSGLGWEPGAFRTAYHENRADISKSSFEANSVAVAIRDFVTPAAFPKGWSGTPTELLAALNERIPENTLRAMLDRRYGPQPRKGWEIASIDQNRFFAPRDSL